MAHSRAGGALPYVAALDGLRALAVVAVVGYHASLDEVPGGFFGVDVFFVLSGYLVTALFLLRAGDAVAPDSPATLDFWQRRARRLVPAAVAAVLATWLTFALLNVRSLADLTEEAFAVFGYVANWFFLFANQSYFETISSPSPFLHFWSLAVEAQFYLVWPLLLIAALHFGGRLSAFALAVSLAAVSTLVVAALYSPVTDPSRAYYGTDARVAGLLLGAALAIVARPDQVARLARAPIEVGGWLGLAVLVWLITSVSEFDPFIYRGGFFLTSVATLCVLAAALHGRNTVSSLLSVAPLRWLGERSYSIYLWHWPVFVLTQPQMSGDLRSLSLLLARLGLTLILAELSYRLVEDRFRRGRTWSLPRFDLGSGPYWQRPWARPASIVGAGLAIVLAGGVPVRSGLADEMADISAQVSAHGESVTVGLPTEGSAGTDVPASPTAESPTTTPDTPTPFPSSSPTETDTPSAAPTSEETQTADGAPFATATGTATSEPTADPTPNEPPSSLGSSEVDPTASATEEAPPAATPSADGSGTGVTVIGDSVTLGAAGALTEALPGAIVDGEVGRQFYAAPGVVAALDAQGALGDIVVVHLGANGPFTDEQFSALMDALRGRTVVLVNVTVPRRWESEVNDSLARHAGAEGIPLVDWHTLSAGETAYFGADGVHLTSTGQVAYAGAIADTVNLVMQRLTAASSVETDPDTGAD